MILATYEGDISPLYTWDMLRNCEHEVVLIDVRTFAEWAWVGYPDISSTGRDMWKIEWLQYPQMTVNPEYLSTLVRKVEINLTSIGSSGKLLILCFICRSGSRSLHAGMAFVDYFSSKRNGDEVDSGILVYNVSSGFEGRQDDRGHRSCVEGWKFDGLPWIQQ